MKYHCADVPDDYVEVMREPDEDGLVPVLSRCGGVFVASNLRPSDAKRLAHQILAAAKAAGAGDGVKRNADMRGAS